MNAPLRNAFCLAVCALVAVPSIGSAAALNYEMGPLLTTSGDPGDYVVEPGDTYGGVAGAYDGVARIYVETVSGDVYGGSGSLLYTGRHILTAAHVLTDGSGAIDVSASWIYFELPWGSYLTSGTAYITHPDWNGDSYRGNDIAVIELGGNVLADIPRYQLYEDTDEVGQVGAKVGYGISGNGDDGADRSLYPFGTKRAGQNRYDSTADMMLDALGPSNVPEYVPGSVLQYDFDSGLEENDAFGYFFGIEDLGLGLDEVSAASGDSGGPTFIDGKIAGVTSYGISLAYSDGSTSDVNSSFDASFGEFVGDTRVSFHADWIHSVVVPEPSSVTLVGSLLGGLASAAGLQRRRRRRAKARPSTPKDR